MTKKFLVDGYNLAHKLGFKIAKSTLELSRATVEHRLLQYASFKRCQFLVVYDGRGVLGSTKEQHGLTIHYTASGETADARIKSLIDREPAKSRLCVISSDNEILRYARASRVEVKRSEAFIAELNALKTSDAPQGREPRQSVDQKPSAMSENELKEWKKLFS
jgi:predicted RNA-binding protein with PIN domain